ncbi:murein hydrolase activator EnvC family protein [Streptomyces sp. G45]|uniref:murein hydrolase activator EnvC family protein n=1 Tax=Streptomyces sp. G45 TaxID=3406627 RepID=UPI003C2471F6
MAATALLLAVLLLAGAVPIGPVGAAVGPAPPPVPAVGGAWPVGPVGPVGSRPVVLRGWEPPASAYGPGHRGVDLAAAPGAPVRAAAGGRVSFAGRVAGRGVVSVELPGTGSPPLRTTYEPLRPAVEKGTRVRAGDPLGTLDPTARRHCPAPCLHWGLRRADTYLNPLALLPPWLLNGGPSRLLPVRAAGGAPWGAAGVVPPGAAGSTPLEGAGGGAPGRGP